MVADRGAHRAADEDIWYETDPVRNRLLALSEPSRSERRATTLESVLRYQSLPLLVAVGALLAGCATASKSSATATSAFAAGTRLDATNQRAGFDATLDSGLRIRVLYGPTCPVQRVGESCVRPYQASIRIVREPVNRTVTTVRSAADGRVSVRLRPGRYLLKPQTGRPLPRAVAETVTVHAHRFASVIVNYDSGIR